MEERNKLEAEKNETDDPREIKRIDDKLSDLNLKRTSLWVAGTIWGILSNTIYKGERIYGDKLIATPVIIEPSYWQKCQD